MGTRDRARERARADAGRIQIGSVGGLNALERVVAVVGCQRSGTTLTGQILGAHPAALLIDEEDGLYAWFHARVARRDDAGALEQAMLERAAAKYRRPEDRIRRSAAGFAPAGGIRVLVLKAPNLTFDDDLLDRLGVPVSVVYPVRDPRAVVASMQRLTQVDFTGNQRRLIAERPRAAVAYAAELRTLADETVPPWVRRATVWRVKSGRANDFAARGLPVDRFRYEDLVSAPDAIVARLLALSGLAPSDSVAHAGAAYMGFGPGGTDRTRPIDRASESAWSAQLSPAQQRDVLAAAAPLADTFGYA